MWESSRILLPEHREAYLSQRRQANRHLQPELDEQRLDELSNEVTAAIRRQSRVKIFVYDPYENKSFTGRIRTMDPIRRKLCLETNDERIWINIRSIVKIESV